MPRMIGAQLKSTYRQLHITHLTDRQWLIWLWWSFLFDQHNNTLWLCFQHANWQMVWLWPTWMLLFSVFVFECEYVEQRGFWMIVSYRATKVRQTTTSLQIVEWMKSWLMYLMVPLSDWSFIFEWALLHFISIVSCYYCVYCMCLWYNQNKSTTRKPVILDVSTFGVSRGRRSFHAVNLN